MAKYERTPLTRFVAVAQALGDGTRLRALLALRGGELCVCDLIALLGLAPSTVSRHLALLWQAGLVERRKEGRWHYYRLAAAGAEPLARRALALAAAAAGDSPEAAADARTLRERRAAAGKEAPCRRPAR